MTTPWHFPLLAFAVLFCLLSRATAGPPFITDDPEPVEYQHWELYIATQDFKNADGWTGTSPHIELNYGGAPGLQLHLIAPLEYNAPKDGASHFGYGDTELGFKLRFVDEAEGRWWPQIGIFPLLEVPTGNHEEGLGNGRAQAYIPVWLQKSWDKDRWTLYGGGGWWYDPGPGNENYWFTGVVLQRKITEKFALGAEIFRNFTPLSVDGISGTGMNLGFMWDLADNYHLIGSAGHSVDGPAQTYAYLAFQFTWGPEKEQVKRDK